MQTSYGQNMAVGYAGQREGIGPHDVRSMLGIEQIGFGLACFRNIGEAYRVRLPNANVCTASDDGGTFTAGSLSCTINGEHTATVTYGGAVNSKATAMAALAVNIAALSIIATCTYAGVAFTITAANNVNLRSVTFDFSAVTGTMVALVSTVYACTETFFGISESTAEIEQFSGEIVIDKAVLTWSGAIEAADTILTTLNGNTLALITFAGTEAATLAALCALIAAQDGVYSCTLSATRVVTILMQPGLPLQVGVAYVDNNAGGVVVAIAHSAQNPGNVGKVWYKPGDTVNVMRKGMICVMVEEAVTPESLVHFRHFDSGLNRRGQFRASTDSNTATLLVGYRFLVAADACGISAIELNLP